MNDRTELDKIMLDRYETIADGLGDTNQELKDLLTSLITEYKQLKEKEKKTQDALDNILIPKNDQDPLAADLLAKNRIVKELKSTLKNLAYRERTILETIRELSKSVVEAPAKMSDILQKKDTNIISKEKLKLEREKFEWKKENNMPLEDNPNININVGTSKEELMKMIKEMRNKESKE